LDIGKGVALRSRGAKNKGKRGGREERRSGNIPS
jgi:hypothetical protein